LDFRARPSRAPRGRWRWREKLRRGARARGFGIQPNHARRFAFREASGKFSAFGVSFTRFGFVIRLWSLDLVRDASDRSGLLARPDFRRDVIADVRFIPFLPPDHTSATAIRMPWRLVESERKLPFERDH
jgi:hypothetical protein